MREKKFMFLKSGLLQFQVAQVKVSFTVSTILLTNPLCHNWTFDEDDQSQ